MRALLILFGLLCLPAHAQPDITEKYIEYSISPKSTDDLMQALNRSSPVKQNGNTYHAYTDTDVSWKFWKHKFNNKCQLNEVETQVEITYTLPKLNKSRASRPVLAIWKQYYPALVQHEKGHGQFAIDAANHIEKALKLLPPANNCSELNDLANHKARSILNSYTSKHKTYDHRTDHGSSQGADLSLYLQ